MKILDFAALWRQFGRKNAAICAQIARIWRAVFEAN